LEQWYPSVKRTGGRGRAVSSREKYVNSVPLVGGGRKPLRVWRSAFAVLGDRGDVGALGVS
jgi:hypothetical protein